MAKTLLLCFIHGFKGDEETFFQFPENLRNLVAQNEPDLDVQSAVYPKYETRGDLAGCVENFKEWLQDRVTDLELNASNTQAILNPSVRVILVAHSVGGLVAADALFSVLDNRPVSSDPNVKLMFPLIQGIIAFDTPYNGLSRSMFAYGAFSQYQNLSSIWNIGSATGSLLSGRGAAAVSNQAMQNQAPSWKRWQLLAARTGTYGAILAGGVAAYLNRAEIAESLSQVNRESISESWSKVNRANLYEGIAQVPAYVSRDSIGEGFAWMASHLKFVGALMKQAQLKTRLERLSQLEGVGVVDFYTTLGENGYWTGGYFVPKRSFCAIPTEPAQLKMFREQANTKSKDEIAAHCSMFRPDKNPKYEEMAEAARDIVVEWLKSDPRDVVDKYQPTVKQRDRSMSEAHLWDDDGNVLDQKKGRTSGDREDMFQLQAILNASGMPESTDGGLSDEDLKMAAKLPLPVEGVSEEAMRKLWDGQEPPKTWRSRMSSPLASSQFSKMSMLRLPAMPSMPAVVLPWRNRQNHALNANKDSSKQENAASSPKEDVKKVDEVKEDTRQPEGQRVSQTTTQDTLEEDEADQVLKGWAVPQEVELQKADEMLNIPPAGISNEEAPKAGTARMEAPIQE